MHSQLLLSGYVPVVAMLLTGVYGVRRPHYLANARVAPEYHEEVFDREVTIKMTAAPSTERSNVMSSSKCCKTGERVAKEGLYCSYDIHVVSKTPNFIMRSKLKQYNHDQTKTHVREYKSLTLRIGRCFHHKSMFEKCCNYKASYLMSMKRCRDLSRKDRKQCRLKTRKTFGV